MIRIILLAHGGLALSMLETVCGILGPCSQMAALDLTLSQSPQVYYNKVHTLFFAGACDQPVLVITDIHGGTPWRVAHTLAQEDGKAGRIKVLAGMNAAMVLEACSLLAQDMQLDELTDRVQAAAIEGIRS